MDAPRALGGIESASFVSHGPEFRDFLLVAEAGLEPRDLRVMSPASYHTAPLREGESAGCRAVRTQLEVGVHGGARDGWGDCPVRALISTYVGGRPAPTGPRGAPSPRTD